MYFANQLGLFGDEGPAVKVSYRRKRIQDRIKEKLKGRVPRQLVMKIRLREKPRKIDFRKRTREDASLGNDLVWTDQAKLRIHQEMIREWEERLTNCCFKDEVDYWTWMLADEEGQFSFRMCLVASGYRHPDQVIEALHARRPAWYRAMEMLPEGGRITWLNAINAICNDEPSRSRAV